MNEARLQRRSVQSPTWILERHTKPDSGPEPIHGNAAGLSPQRWRVKGYLALNFAFFLAVAAMSFLGSQVRRDPLLYLVLLFALCSSPILFVREVNGRSALFAVAMPVLFVWYGLSDLLGYFITVPALFYVPGDALLSDGEAAILAGTAALSIGCALALRFVGRSTRDRWLVRDWSVIGMVTMGLLFVPAGIWGSWVFASKAGIGEVFKSISNELLVLTVVAKMLEQLGAVMLSYAYLKTENRTLGLLLLGIALLKLPVGILVNSKEVGISFMMIFFITKWIYSSKVPARWLGAGLLIMLIYFPLSYAYRETIGVRHVSTGAAMAEAGQYLDKALAKNAEGAGLEGGVQALAGRIGLKSQTEMILARAGRDVRYQDGWTLVELPYAFIPRWVWPEKPSISVGQLFNREFHISADPNTYISMGFIGELYWNFGLIGMCIGMFVIGFTWGCIGWLTAMDNCKTIARMLVLIVAIYTFVLRYEAAIAMSYVLFLRSTMIVLFLHLVFREPRATHLAGQQV